MTHRIVSVEATEEMLAEGIKSHSNLQEIYQAMLAAAPVYEITDADVERALEVWRTSPTNSLRAILEDFVKRLGGGMISDD